MPDTNRAQPCPPHNRIWCVGNVEFDEQRRELRVAGQLRAVESKPLLLFEALLRQAGRVVPKEELLARVWKDRTVVEQSLATAIGKLREALGDEGRLIVEAVRGVGYRVAAPVELRAAPEMPRLAFGFQAGDPVPNRPQWYLDHPLGNGAARDVWLARHGKTGEQRVFKFADTTERRRDLRREAALSRILRRALGDRPDFMPVSEWNFEHRPYFLESAYGGPDLAEWASSRGGLASLPLAARVGIVARIARTVAAAHGVGVLHRDVKPANVLVGDADGTLLRLVDFGSGRLTEAARLEAVTVTGLGLTAGAAEDDRVSGTLRYMAPEILAGGPPTVAADVYALGILLYQLVVGDLGRALGVGWESDVADPLLREDLGAAAAADPTRRLSSAAALAERLEGLEERRAARAEAIRQQNDSRRLAAQVERARLRRPWLALAAASLVLGVIGTGISAVRATRARDEAREQADVARRVNAFLTDDLLGRGDPASSGKPDETLMEAVAKAEPQIDARFRQDPLVAASIYGSLAQVFSGRNAYAQARTAYDRALDAFDRAEGPDSADATILRLRRVPMEVASSEPGAMERARQLIGHAGPRVPQLGGRSAEARVWLSAAQAMTQILGGDMRAAEEGFGAAADLADTIPDVIDEESRFWFRQRQAFSYNRLGEWGKASAILDVLLRRQMALHGPHHPDTLVVEQIQAMVLMASGQSLSAISKVDAILDDLVKTYGPDHRFTLQAYGTRAVAEGMIERYDDAIRDDTVLYKASLAKQGPRAMFTFTALADLATAECRSGQADGGLSHALEALDAAKATFGPANAVAQAISGAAALCLIRLGRYAEATPYLNGLDDNRVGQFAADPDNKSSVLLLRAAIADGLGDREKAREFLRQPLLTYARPGSDRYFHRWAMELDRSLSEPKLQ